MDPSWTRKWPPGRSQQAGEWALVRLAGTAAAGRRFEAAALVQALYACVVQPDEPDELVVLTLALAGPRIRITGHSTQELGPAAACAWDQQATRLADRHSAPGEPDGLWAELDLEGVAP